MLRRRAAHGCLAAFLSIAAASGGFSSRNAGAAPKGAAVEPERPAPPKAPPLSLDRLRETPAGFVVDLSGGGRAELTLDPRLERLAEKLLAQQAAPLASAVVVSVDDGRVLAMAGRSSAEPERRATDLALKAWAPAASVFKVVTAAALVGKGVRPETRVCYHGGLHALDESHLRFRARLDQECNTLAFGLAKSQNAIMARLANDHLDLATLERTARSLGFGAALPFDVPVAPSTAAIPSEPLAFAQTAAGFWRTSLSPLHGAYLAATIARGGTTPPLHLVDRVVVGKEQHARRAPASRRVLDAATARAVGKMMVGTTSYGTARLGFHDPRGNAYLDGVSVAGKTGSLSGWQRLGRGVEPSASPKRVDESQQYLAYSWFVGYAPAERPKVAVAVLLGNGDGAQPRAHQLARRLLEGYFKKEKAPSKPAARALLAQN